MYILHIYAKLMFASSITCTCCYRKHRKTVNNFVNILKRAKIAKKELI